MRGSRCVRGEKWLGHQDSNLDSWNQNPESCRWTMAQCGSGRRRKRRPRSFVVDREGFEPAALGLKVPCSTN